MKPKRIIQSDVEQPKAAPTNPTPTPGTATPNPTPNPNAAAQNVAATETKKLFSFNNANVFWFLLALALAVGLKFLAGLLIIGTSIGFVWKEIITLLFAFLIAGAYGSMSKEGKMAGSIVIFLILITASNLVRHDYSAERADRQMDKQAKNIVVDKNKISYLIYEPGKTYAYELQAGESTPWRGFKDNYYSKVGYYSESYDYTIHYSDGTSYEGGANIKLPCKNGKMFMRIVAHSPQTVYVSTF